MSRTAIAGGIAIGVVYALSPMTVWFTISIALVLWWVRRDLARAAPQAGADRSLVTWILIIAVAIRVAAVAALFLVTDHARVQFGSFFGDEEYFITRSLWLRNLAFGVPIHQEDLVSAFDLYSASSYLYLLALIQMLVGPAPYGLHLLGVLFYLVGVILLYRLARGSLGRMPAIIGLVTLLFLPSLFAWSVSALKEPLFVMLSALNLIIAVGAARGRSWLTRCLALAAVVVLAALLETVRQGGAVLSALGVFTGLVIAFVAVRPRVMLAAAVAMPILLGAALSRPEVQFKAYTALQNAARQHWGHVATQGYAYQLLDQRFYSDRSEIEDLQAAEAMRFIVRAGVGYLTVPLPWKVQSRPALAYLPEQVVWYVVAALAPAGIFFGFRRDALVTGLLIGHAVLIAVTVALTSGNVGTLVRHRGLVLPYIVWLSAVGGCELMLRMRSRWK